MKKRQWTVRRHTLEQVDAHHRWDRSYQYLVQWSAVVLKELPTEPFSQESQDESRCVCTSLHPAPSTGPDDRTTTRSLTRVQSKPGMAVVR